MEVKEEKTFIKSLGLCGESGMGGNTSVIDVKDGRIIRIRPLRYDWKYKPEEFGTQKIESISTEKDVNVGDIKLHQKVKTKA